MLGASGRTHRTQCIRAQDSDRPQLEAASQAWRPGGIGLQGAHLSAEQRPGGSRCTLLLPLCSLASM